MSETTDRLDSIQANVNRHRIPGGIAVTPSDVAFLLDLARKQQAALDAVRDIAYSHEAKDNPTIATYLITEALEGKP